MKRSVDILVISDLQLSNSVKRLEQLSLYLKGVQPKTLVIIGKIFDFRSNPFNSKNNVVVNILQQLLAMSMDGANIYYISGSDDHVLSNFAGAQLGNIEIRESLLLRFSGKKYWIVHENHFRDKGNENSLFTKFSRNINQSVYKFSNVCKRIFGVESDTEYANRSTDATIYPCELFEKKFASEAEKRNYDAIITSSGYRPDIKDIALDGSLVAYMNCGKWSKHLTALENTHGRWRIYTFDSMHYGLPNPKLGIKKVYSLKSPAPFYKNDAVKEIQL